MYKTRAPRNLLILMAVQAASAGTAQADDAGVIEEVVVSATRMDVPISALPSTFEVINRDALEMQTQIGGSAVDAVAALVPSFSPTRQKLSGSGETLRGRSPLYLVDGVPQSSPLRDDSRDGFTIDPFFIERVEVIFGSNAIQGIGATGGVVNYVTVPSPREGDGWGGSLLTQGSVEGGGEDDGFGYKVAGRIGRDFGVLDFTVGAAYEQRGAYYDANGLRVGHDGAQGETQDSTSNSVFGRLGVDVGDSGRLELMANHFELEGDGDYVTIAGSRADGIPTSAVRGTPEGDTPMNEVTTVSLTYTDTDLFGGRLSGQLYYNDYEGVFGGGTFVNFQDASIAPVGTLFDQSANNSEKRGFKLAYDRGVERLDGFRYVLGLDGIRDETYQALVQTDRLWVPETAFESLAPFAQLHQALWDDRVNLAAGVRYEDATLEVDDYTTLASYGSQQVGGGSPHFTETLVNYGVTYAPVDGLTLYASYAEGFTMPDVGRVLRAVNVPGQDIDTFLDVSPIVTDNTEVGAEYSVGPVDLSAAYFWSQADKGQFLVLVDGVYEVQRQRTEIDGLELSARWRTPVEGLAVAASYAALNGQTDSDGNGKVDADLDGSNIAPDRALLALDYARGNWSARVQGQFYLSREFAGGDPRNDFEGYELVDAWLSYQAPFGDLTLSAQNLFDEQYISYFSDTTGPTDDLRYFAGRGRVITLGYQKKF
ncbi:MAG TPA: TonB-dependent receptor [Steroidobacteraceae bacterium]|nr:TonB-dependent receptor [Steroidobacteraceae bacterium]